MSLKERVKSNVEKIVVKGHQVNEEVISFVKEDYAKTLDEVGTGMDTVKETTLEYLIITALTWFWNKVNIRLDFGKNELAKTN